MNCGEEIEEEYRCNETIDLEEIIKMQNEDKSTHVRCEATYKSGRTEEFEAELLKHGKIPSKFSKKVSDLRNFPTVENVKTEKYDKNA